MGAAVTKLLLPYAWVLTLSVIERMLLLTNMTRICHRHQIAAVCQMWLAALLQTLAAACQATECPLTLQANEFEVCHEAT